MKAWLKLVFCLLAIWIFVEGFPMILSHITSYQEVIVNSENMGIDNAALFYSEEAYTSIAENKLYESLRSGEH